MRSAQIDRTEDLDGIRANFKAVLGPRSPQREEALFGLSINPEKALRQLNKGDRALELTAKGSADVLDEVLGAIADPEEARTLLHQWIDPDRLRDLIKGRGDLPSVVSEIASLEDVLAAALSDIRDEQVAHEQAASAIHGREEQHLHAKKIVVDASQEEGHEFQDVDDDEDDESDDEVSDGDPDVLGSPLSLLTFYAWALKIRDRVDYGDFLEMRVGCFSVRELLALAVWEISDSPDRLYLIPGESFDRVGLDHSESIGLLKDLLAREDVQHFDAEQLEEARQELTRRHDHLDQAPLVMTPADAKLKAENIGHKLGF